MTTAPTAAQQLVFEVQRPAWQQHRLVTQPLPADLAADQVLFRVDRFALTANNITYAVAGDMLGYWNFFPTEDGWGRIPVMGYADVIGSRHPKVREGERVFGFFPMGTHLVIEASNPSDAHFLDAATHRAKTSVFYRQYLRTSGDALHEPAHEDTLLLLRGLFMTSFLVDDFLADRASGAATFVVSSASSKTAIALAFQLSKRHAGHVVGLTSAGNRAFVESLGYYDQVLCYDEIEALPNQGSAVLIDHAGNGAVVGAVHERFGERLVHSCIIGVTHWDAAPRAATLPGAAPTLFFAPAQAEKRTREWGAAGFQQRLGAAWEQFRAASEKWLHVVRDSGPAAVERVYTEMLAGRTAPRDGHILSMWEGKPR
jgi:hypothetical protein